MTSDPMEMTRKTQETAGLIVDIINEMLGNLSNRSLIVIAGFFSISMLIVNCIGTGNSSGGCCKGSKRKSNGRKYSDDALTTTTDMAIARDRQGRID